MVPFVAPARTSGHTEYDQSFYWPLGIQGWTVENATVPGGTEEQIPYLVGNRCFWFSEWLGSWAPRYAALYYAALRQHMD